jgi:hypothetical protein
MSAGQAAYEAWDARRSSGTTVAWDMLRPGSREAWEAAAQAATDAKPGSERVAELVTEGNDLRKELAEVREALAEAAGHVEPVDQNSELAIARWRELARPEAGHA